LRPFECIAAPEQRRSSEASRSHLARLSALVCLTLLGSSLSAQELEPRLYSNAPVGLNAVVAGVQLSRGNILVEPSLPLEDVDGDMAIGVVGYARTLGLFGKAAKIDVVVPFGGGQYEGFVVGNIGDFEVEPGEKLFATRELSGFADPRVRVSVNLVGSPALKREEFGGYSQKTIVGVSLQVIAPLGQYDPSKLFNLSTNRWTFRPEVGFSQAFGSWVAEVATSVFLFTRNDDFFGGSTLEQDPLWTIKAHLIRNFRPGLWVSFNFGHGRDGRVFVNQQQRSDLHNWRFGLSASIPLAPGHRLIAVGASGRTDKVGADFDVLGLIYQFTWGG